MDIERAFYKLDNYKSIHIITMLLIILSIILSYTHWTGHERVFDGSWM